MKTARRETEELLVVAELAVDEIAKQLRDIDADGRLLEILRNRLGAARGSVLPAQSPSPQPSPSSTAEDAVLEDALLDILSPAQPSDGSDDDAVMPDAVTVSNHASEEEEEEGDVDDPPSVPSAQDPYDVSLEEEEKEEEEDEEGEEPEQEQEQEQEPVFADAQQRRSSPERHLADDRKKSAAMMFILANDRKRSGAMMFIDDEATVDAPSGGVAGDSDEEGQDESDDCFVVRDGQRKPFIKPDDEEISCDDDDDDDVGRPTPPSPPPLSPPRQVPEKSRASGVSRLAEKTEEIEERALRSEEKRAKRRRAKRREEQARHQKEGKGKGKIKVKDGDKRSRHKRDRRETDDGKERRRSKQGHHRHPERDVAATIADDDKKRHRPLDEHRRREADVASGSDGRKRRRLRKGTDKTDTETKAEAEADTKSKSKSKSKIKSRRRCALQRHIADAVPLTALVGMHLAEADIMMLLQRRPELEKSKTAMNRVKDAALDTFTSHLEAAGDGALMALCKLAMSADELSVVAWKDGSLPDGAMVQTGHGSRAPATECVLLEFQSSAGTETVVAARGVAGVVMLAHGLRIDRLMLNAIAIPKEDCKRACADGGDAMATIAAVDAVAVADRVYQQWRNANDALINVLRS